MAGQATASPQLALPVGLEDEATLENFLTRPELAAVRAAAAVDPLRGDADEALIYLHGAAEGGKSHLLQAVCHRRPGAVYLPLDALGDEVDATRLLDGLEAASLVALDGLDAVAADAAWEEGLFHLINRARSAACPLWFAARRPPGALALALPDLQSRLAGGVVYALPAPDEEAKLAILRFRARRRGLELPDAVAKYLTSRGSRSLADLLAGLERLDAASLQLKRPLTIPLVREVMGW